jgi:hypothetical protein
MLVGRHRWSQTRANPHEGVVWPDFQSPSERFNVGSANVCWWLVKPDEGVDYRCVQHRIYAALRLCYFAFLVAPEWLRSWVE